MLAPSITGSLMFMVLISTAMDSMVMILYIFLKILLKLHLQLSHYPNGVNYTAAEQSALFFKYIDQDKYLRDHKGQYAERNGAQAPWRNQVDIKLIQDIFMNVGKTKNTIQLTLDIFNFGNLIDPNWGKVKTVNASFCTCSNESELHLYLAVLLCQLSALLQIGTTRLLKHSGIT